MAGTDLNLSLVLEERVLKISSMSQPRSPANHRASDMPPTDLAVVPWLRLAGRWLEKAGFAVDGQVKVQVEMGRLVITAV